MDVHRSSGATRTVLGVVGAHKVEKELIETPRRRARGAAHHRALQARQPHLQAGGHHRHHRRCADRRRRGDRDGRPLLGGDRRAGAWPSAAAVKRAGAKILRGGAFKPRSSPYSFQGLGEQGLQMLRRAADAHNLKLISEVMDISQIELIDKVLRHLPGRRAQHAELHAAARAGARAQAGAARSAASRRRSRSGCCRPSTSWPAATTT